MVRARFDKAVHRRCESTGRLLFERLEERVSIVLFLHFNKFCAVYGRRGEDANAHHISFCVRRVRANAINHCGERLYFGLSNHFLDHGFRKTLKLRAVRKRTSLSDFSDALNAALIIEVGEGVRNFRHGFASCGPELTKQFLEVTCLLRNLSFEVSKRCLVGIKLSAQSAAARFCSRKSATGVRHLLGLSCSISLEFPQALLVFSRHLAGVLTDFGKNILE